MTKKRIILHGFLKDLYPHPIEVEATSVAEALRSLQQIPELTPANGEPYPVRIRGVERESQLMAASDLEEIHVIPETGGGGGGGGGFFRILVGITLVGLALVFPAGILGMSAQSLALSGGLLIVGGLIELMTPKQKLQEPGENRSSATLGSAANTTRIGTPIGMGYGTYKIGGQYLSFDIDATQYDGRSTAPDGVFGEDASGHYTEYDKTPVAFAPILPVYPSATTSPNNQPTSGWIA